VQAHQVERVHQQRAAQQSAHHALLQHLVALGTKG
jgi:hypothetical protein